MPPLRHFIDTQDFEKSELLAIIELIGQLKKADKVGACPHLLGGASLGMLFEEPSTRTRVCFEVAMTKLGGHALGGGSARRKKFRTGARPSCPSTSSTPICCAARHLIGA